VLSAFLVSAFVVAVAEIGDKTQLLSLLLAARYRRPVPIVAGILVATIANHALAALLGEWVRAQFDAATLRWVLGLSLLAVAAWVLKPDRMDAEVGEAGRRGVFLLSFLAFFVAEIGDKTQVATVVLAAQYHALPVVVLGTTVGMMAANVPAVLLGSAFAPRIPLRAVRAVAALSFAVLGVLVLAGGVMT
jgi:putative Ca2+/H+ antiporter (TMEM165/GDT1 family)